MFSAGREVSGGGGKDAIDTDLVGAPPFTGSRQPSMPSLLPNEPVTSQLHGRLRVCMCIR